MEVHLTGLKGLISEAGGLDSFDDRTISLVH